MCRKGTDDIESEMCVKQPKMCWHLSIVQSLCLQDQNLRESHKKLRLEGKERGWQQHFTAIHIYLDL
jgi:hypothetical protein